MKNTKNYIVIISIFYSLTLNLSIYANEFVVFRVDTSKNYLKISNTVSNHVLHSLRDSDSNYVYLSTDNGQNWALVFKEKRVAYLPYLANIEKLLIVSENSFLLSYDQGFVLVTTDKGNSWRQQIPDSTFVNANAYNAFVYNDNAYLYHHSRLFQADNQFTSWNQIKEPFGIDLKSTFWHIALTKSGYMFCTKYNLVDTTVQYLRVFLENDEPEEFNLPQYMNRYYFIDKDVGWSFHKTPYGDQHPPINYNIIYKTDDGGKNWIKQLDTTAIFLSFMGIKFFNHNIGYAYGYNSLLYFTDDGGINWKQLFP